MVTVKETLRGNERIQQLMEEFPEIHRTVVIKADLLREGIRPNETTRRLGKWALPYAPWYFEYAREGIHSVQDKVEGYFEEPLMGHFRNGLTWQFLWLSSSPYEVRYEGAGRYWLYRDDEAIEEVVFSPRPPWMDRSTSSGKPMCSVISGRGEDLLMVTGLNYCEFFKDGNGCRYCNINPTESLRKDQGLQRVAAKRDKDLYETFVSIHQDGPTTYPGKVTLSGGAMLDVGKEATNYARIARVLKRAMKDVGHECRISVAMQAARREDQERLKEAGVSSVCFPLEVWDPRLFEIICPGKAKNVGREGWLERLVTAVEVFGRGNVNSAFVEGIELVHPDGFKSEDEAAESFLEGCKWLYEHGIVGIGVLFRPVPNTMFAAVIPPRTEYFLRVELARHKMSIAHDLMYRPGQVYRNPQPALNQDLVRFALRQAPAAGPGESVRRE